MEEYCCNCAEIIWNPLSFERILSQVREYVENNYSKATFNAWNNKVNALLLKKHEKFSDVSFCPHCIVSISKRLLEEIAGKEDRTLDKFLLSFEGI